MVRPLVYHSETVDTLKVQLAVRVFLIQVALIIPFLVIKQGLGMTENEFNVDKIRRDAIRNCGSY